jgi:hypothetical protein
LNQLKQVVVIHVVVVIVDVAIGILSGKKRSSARNVVRIMVRNEV